MIFLNTSIYTPNFLPFMDATGTPGKVLGDFSISVVREDQLYAVTPVLTEVTSALYSLEVTFPETGTFFVFVDGIHIGTVMVMSKDMYQVLQDLDDVALGSWTYDKKEETLVLSRKNGEELAAFNVTDNPSVSTRLIP